MMCDTMPMIIPAYLIYPWLNSMTGEKRKRHITINIQEWVICLWPYLCSIKDEKGNTLPIADLGVSISGRSELMPHKANTGAESLTPKLVSINSVNNIPNDICVSEVIPL
jgi:hypothetical protein